ncbi:MAG: hypothetical protein NPINA01_13990 [Nitrospinaceae bacterium]|nr:MAG: hypothetical protein NPINA01_13990 [Nitrospinaceae bacterium]
MVCLDSNYPEGLKFLETLDEQIFNSCTQQTYSFIENNSGLGSKVEGIGTLLSCLSRLSICHWGCLNDREHTKEYLLGKACDSISAGWVLLKSGHYDSCFSVIRDTAEITNLFMLFSQVPEQYNDWKSSDQKTIRSKFNPGSVRKALDEKGLSIPIDKKIYNDFSQRFVHVSPNTRPQLHSNMDRPVASGTFQKSGVENTVRYMAHLISQLALTSTLLLKPNYQISEYIYNSAIKLKEMTTTQNIS